MQTYVNRNGDVYLSTMPRMIEDIPVAPKPFEEAIFNFEKGQWEMPFYVIFKLVKDIRKTLLHSPKQVSLSTGNHVFFNKDIAMIKSYLDSFSGPIQWKSISRKENGAPVFITLSQDDLSQVLATLTGHSRQCFEYENIATKAISEFIAEGCPEVKIPTLFGLLTGFNDMGLPEEGMNLARKAVDVLTAFTRQENSPQDI